MNVDEKYFKSLMRVLASLHNPIELKQSDINDIRNKAEIILQQGKALLDNGKVPFEKKMNESNIPTWKDFT